MDYVRENSFSSRENLLTPSFLALQASTKFDSHRYANHCPNLCQPSTPTPETTPPSNRNEVFTLTQAQQNYARERVNQVTMKKVQDAPNMVSVTSLVNSILS
jgi:hypothetical protein